MPNQRKLHQDHRIDQTHHEVDLPLHVTLHVKNSVDMKIHQLNVEVHHHQSSNEVNHHLVHQTIIKGNHIPLLHVLNTLLPVIQEYLSINLPLEMLMQHQEPQVPQL